MCTSRLPQLRLSQLRLTQRRLRRSRACSSSRQSNRFATLLRFVASQSRAVITLLLVWSLVWSLVCETMAPHYARFTTDPAAKSAVVSVSAAAGLKSEQTSRLSKLVGEFLAGFGGLSSEVSSSSGPPVDTLTDAIISRRAPAIYSGRIEGALRVLQGEPFSINANTSITGDLFLPGSPSIQLNGGAQHAGLIDDGGAATPSNYTVKLSGGINLPGHIHTHVDAVALPADFPQSVPAATGMRKVTVRSQSDVAVIGDWQTVRDLNVTKSGVVITVPPGNYGTFTVNGNSRLEFSAGTYNFANTLNLDGGASLQATGAVIINVSQNLTVNSGAVVLGSYTTPADVRLNVLGAAVNLNGSSQVSGLLRAYNATFTANGNSQVRGQVIANQVTLNGGKVTGAVWPAHSNGQMVIFGPRRFDRTTGSPNQYQEQFALPDGVTSPYTLHIRNGESNGANRVSSAKIKLNGSEVLVQNDLNQTTVSLDRSVSLNATNTLEVRLDSDPGSYLIISISGPVPVMDTTPPTLSITAPANNITTTAGQVDLSGTAADTGTAATGVAQVYVNGLEAAFDDTRSTWTVTGVPLLLGANQITVRAIDGAGNETTTSINITRAAPNDPPVVDAGPDQTFALPHTAALHGTASDDGLPSESSLSISWSVVSHPGTVTFSSADSLNTSATFSVPGSYVLRLSASDGELLTSDDITITVQPENQPPTVYAGPNQTIALPHVATLNGTVTDDGLPADSTMTILWSQVSGPGTVTFEAPFQSETIATFSAPGSYVLRLTASDGDLTAASDVTITVHPENHAPTADAGADQIITLPNPASLNGSATDDGLPVGSTLTTTWTVVNGPGTVMFTNSGVTVTSAAFSQPGTYVLRLTASDSEMNASDDVVITVIPENHAPSVNAGADQTIALPATATLNGSAADDGLPPGSTLITTWSKLSGPGDVTLASPNTSPTSAAFSAPGVYVLRLTASDSEFTASDDVQINVVDPRVPPNADFVVPQSGGVASGFVIASSGALGSAFAPDLILDSNAATSWTTNSSTNQFVTIQFFDQQMVFVDRVRLQSRQGLVSNLTLKDFEVQISSTTSDDQSFTTALIATLLNTGQLQEFVLPGGPRRARYLKLIARNNYGGANSITLGTFNPVAVGSADGIISLPGQSNVALCQSPALTSNGGAIYSSSYSGGSSSAVNLPGYFVGGWQAGSTSNQFATIQLAGGKSYTLEGIRLATGFDSTLTGVKDFEVWVSNTTPDDASFSRVLSATAQLVPYAQQFLFPGGPVQARYVKYVPLNNRGGPTINTQAFDVIAEGTARVVGVSAESGVHVNSAQAAFDGITTTNWIASGTITNVWVKTALANAANQQIYGVRILPITDISSQQGPKDFDIRVSTTTTDDSAFTTVYSGTMAPIFNSPPQEFWFSNFVDARYVQFVWKNSYHPSFVGVKELEVLSAPDRGSAIVAFSSQAGTLEAPGNALDIDPIDRAWVTALNQNTNQWLKLQLPRAELWTINHIALGPGPAGSDLTRSPKDFELQVSTTDFADSSFTTVFADTLLNSSPLQDFYFPAAQARYVRLLLKNNYGSGQIALSSFYIYSGEVIGANTRFIDQSSDADGQIASWSWNFGDGSTSTERHPAHTFPAPGDYSVSLTVTDDSGLTSTRQALYHVAPTLQPDFTYSPIISHEGGESVRFTDITPLLVRSTAFRQYDFGDGSTFTQGADTSLHTFPDNGTFHVRLKIGDPLGVSYTVTQDVTVLNVPPSVDIDPGKTIVWGEQWTSVPRISDQGLIDSQSLQGQWKFGDGQTSQCVNCTNAKATVTHAYNNPGTYNAFLTVTDKDGGVASDNATFLVNKRPTALVIESPPPQTAGSPFVIHAQLRDTFANLPLAGKSVQFTLNGASFNTVTGANGVAEVSVALPAGTKIDIVTGNFVEDGYYLPCTGVAVPPTAGRTPPSGVPSHQGTTFWLMFPYAWFDNFVIAVQTLYITSSVATTGTVTIPGLNFTQNFTVQANSVLTMQLPFSQVQENNVVTAKGIHVTSQQPVSVYGLNKRAFTSDAFLGLPVNALGMDYYILTYSNMSFAPSSELGVVATENGTIVTITPSVTSSGHPGGAPFIITLNQGQTYLLQNLVPTADGDLSGSHVRSNKPIAVFAGHGAATIPAEVGCCADHLVEQLPPTGTWGKRFATMPLATRTKGDFFRFIAAEDGTAIYLSGSLMATLNRGQFTERVLKGPAEIIATNPIMVAQYSASISYDSGTLGKADPFLMIIPPYAQFLKHYTITTPATGFSINYANLVVPTASIGSITMDGSPLPTAGFSTIGVSGFSGAQIPVAVGAHTFDGPVSFGVSVYGYNQDEGYGYPGGMSMIARPRNINVRLAPETLVRSINTQACVIATVTDENENPLGGRSLAFTATGVNPSTSLAQTDAAGQAQLCYIGTNFGTDNVAASVDDSEGTSSIVWLPPNQAPVVNAGLDQSITLPSAANLSGSASDDGLPANTITYSWTKVSGPGNVTLGDASTPATTAIFDSPGIYLLRLTAGDTELSASDEVQITVNSAPPNQRPTANAGPDLSATINGNLIFNGGCDQPFVNSEISGWTEVQGTSWTQAPASGGNPPPQRGDAYFFAGDAAEAELRQDIDVSVFSSRIAAGTQQFEFKAYARSAGETAPDAARVILEYRDASNTNVIATLDSGLITSTTAWHLTEDTRLAPVGTAWIRVRLLANRNTGMTNDAFFDSITLRPLGNAAVKLEGLVTDDGLPFSSTLSAAWTTISGPDVVTFANAHQAATSASFITAGTYVLRITSSDGQLNASDDVTVLINPANQAPIVNAGGNQTITLPASATLSGVVTDDGQPPGGSVPVTWSKVSGPGMVTFADASAAETTASFSTPGTYVLSLNADDTEYSASADVTITVNPAPNNQPPTVSVGADQTISPPADTVTLDGAAADDGLPVGSNLTVAWTTISGPGTVTFGNHNNAVTTAQLSATGTYVLRLSASDGAYLVTDDVTVTLTPPNQAPTANAGSDQTILLSQTADLNGSGSDDGLPFSSTLSTTWSTVSGPGTVTFGNPNVTVTSAHFSATGPYVLRLTASDGELSAHDDVTVTVNDNVAPPIVEITSPADGSELTEPTVINGSVSNGDWALEYSLNSEDGAANQIWTRATSGTGPVANGLLGTLDTTLMLNGIYSVRLKATDIYGQTSFTSIAVVVDKNFKVGHFQVAFSDLGVPVAGLPIEVIRSYDSRDKRVGDFGVGWQLGIRSARVEKSGVLGLSWFQTVSSGAIPTYCLEPSRPHKVAITFGHGKVFKFRASTAIHCQQLAPITATQLTFTPEPGTHATLESTTATDVVVAVLGSIPGPVQLINQNNPDIFNTGTFRLTTAEGTVYVIDQRTGVNSVRDPYGNTLTIGAGGIVHSSGQSVSFMRDGAGRITQITDPNGNAQTYSYDANGDLTSYTDREQNTTTFTYNSNHHPLSIIDARGVELMQNQYDSSGRLIGQTDAFNASLSYDHNVAERVEIVTDRMGRQTRYEYDERGNVLRQVDAKGGVKTLTYDALDNVLTETNPLGKTTTYTYDAADNRTSVTDPLGHVTRFTYNGARQPLTVTDARNNVITNTYDAAGNNLLTTTDALGQTTSYTYSVFTGQRTTMKDALNNVTAYGYDSVGRLSSETDALGHITTFGYDANGNRTTQTVTRTNATGQPETITTTSIYDKLNRLTKTIYADGSSTLVEYNAIGQQSATIDQLGHRTEFTYDEMGRLTRTDYPDGIHDETTYDAEGRRLTSKDRAGRVTSHTYDELGRLIRTTYPDNTFTSTNYDAAGQVLATTDARGNVTRYEYDDSGRRTKVRNALDQETTFTFDANGNQLSITDALGHTTSYEYDANNRRTRTNYADSSFDTVGYDALGRSVSKTDQAGKTTQFIYDSLGRLTNVRDALNQETTYGYDELGQQLSQTDANNHTTRFEYDQLGRRTKRILPLGQFETYAYDLSGNLHRRTDFNSRTTTFTYDVMRRLLSKVPDASLNQPSINFTYNVNGQRATMTDVSGTTVYTYDARNRLASKQTPFGKLSYAYDDLGNLLTTRSSNANGTSVDFAYDALNRLATVKDNNLVTVNSGVTTYTYDPTGNLQSYLYPNGVATTYNYNSLNRLASMNATTPVSTLSSYTYTLGAAGNRTAVTELSGRTVNYTYDALYRLKDETIANDQHGINGTVSYGYDPVGNRLSRTSSVAGVSSQISTYDADDRLTSDIYDANGNTESAGGNNYVYGFENRLTSFTSYDSSLVTFVYDGDGNRVGKTVGGVTTNYLVDTNNHTGYAQVVEDLQGGAVVKQFTYGNDLISQRCTVPAVNCSISFYGYDGHGSARQLTDAAAVVTDTYDYDAFGNLISRTGTTSNDYLYSGEQFDASLGFYYLRARYMNPSNGRFWTMDSFEGGSYDPGSLHKYLYTRNSPSNLIDPTGHFSLVDTVNTSVLIGVTSGFGIGLYTGGIEGAFSGAIQGAIMGAVVPLTGAGVGSFLLGNAARGVFITGWGVGLGSATTSGFSFATATTEEERTSAGISLLASAGFMYFGPKVLQRVNTKVISSDQANAQFLATRNGKGEPPWPSGNLVTETTIFKSAKYIRVYAEGKTKPVGAWVMEASEIDGLTFAQIQQKFALPFRPTHIVPADLPAGTTIRIGMAGPNKFGTGGGMQVQITQ